MSKKLENGPSTLAAFTASPTGVKSTESAALLFSLGLLAIAVNTLAEDVVAVVS